MNGGARDDTAGARGIAIASSHPAATEAATDIVRAGGSFADAIIAAGAVLTVVSQHATSLAGDAIVLSHDARTGKTVCLNATGHAPLAVDPRAFADGMPWRGADTVTSPGLVAGWAALHAKMGRLPWRELFRRAWSHASDGFAVSPRLAYEIAHYADTLRQDEGALALYFRNGLPREAGDVVVQKALASVLAEIMAEGPDAFYRGRAAASISDTVRRKGGALAPEDFAAVRPLWMDPLTAEYRGYDVVVPPPNSYGLALLLQLAALKSEPFPEVSLVSPQRYVRLVTAAKTAFSAAEPFVADPAGAVAPAEALTGDFQRRLQDRYRAALDTMPAMPTGGTATISIADDEGNAIIVLQSVMQEFGSGIVDPGSGILLNNRMSGFTSTPGRANSVMPGKRPAHTLSPSMVLRDGRMQFVIGTPGGSGQTATLAQAVNGLVDLGCPLRDVIDAPRWSLGRGGKVLFESTVPAGVVEEVNACGVEAEQIHTHVPYFGSLEIIDCRQRMPASAVDRRREAHGHWFSLPA